MPGILTEPRIRAIQASRVSRYLAYAFGEVFLIFIGITLAIAFENGAEVRRQNELAVGLLISITENLQANVLELERNIQEDQLNLESATLVIDHMTNSSSWDESLNSHLELALHWSSPFFSNSGYESLKQAGLYIVSNDTLRSDITHLYESTYGYLVGDHDRAMWVFQESVLFPVQSKELVRTDDGSLDRGRFAPRDYETSRRYGELRSMLLEHQFNLVSGLMLRREALEETHSLIGEIDAFLEGNS